MENGILIGILETEKAHAGAVRFADRTPPSAINPKGRKTAIANEVGATAVIAETLLTG
jgi:hypothetical protein